MAFRVIKQRREARRNAKLEEIFTVTSSSCSFRWFISRYNVWFKSRRTWLDVDIAFDVGWIIDNGI